MFLYIGVTKKVGDDMFKGENKGGESYKLKPVCDQAQHMMAFFKNLK